MEKPRVGVIMGSSSDWDVMKHAADILRDFNVAYEAEVISAHRTPDRMFHYAETAAERGLKCIIAGAGGAAHLPGMIAAKTILPVCQYFAYLEVGEHDDRFGRETALWRTYKLIADLNDTLAMRRVRGRSDIYPVFRELFARSRSAAA